MYQCVVVVFQGALGFAAVMQGVTNSIVFPVVGMSDGT